MRKNRVPPPPGIRAVCSNILDLSVYMTAKLGLHFLRTQSLRGLVQMTDRWTDGRTGVHGRTDGRTER